MTTMVANKTCITCGEQKPATTEYFYKQPGVKNGLRGQCNNCMKIAAVQWQQTEVGKQYRKQYSEQYRRKNKAARKQYTPSEKYKTMDKQYGKKYYATVNGHLHRVFNAMKSRCTNPNITNYHRYGGRGVKVCFDSATEFIDYVINTLQINPKGLQIDRIDNNGNYEKGNIRFVTAKENCKNREVSK